MLHASCSRCFLIAVALFRTRTTERGRMTNEAPTRRLLLLRLSCINKTDQSQCVAVHLTRFSCSSNRLIRLMIVQPVESNRTKCVRPTCAGPFVYMSLLARHTNKQFERTIRKAILMSESSLSLSCLLIRLGDSPLSRNRFILSTPSIPFISPTCSCRRNGVLSSSRPYDRLKKSQTMPFYHSRRDQTVEAKPVRL